MGDKKIVQRVVFRHSQKPSLPNSLIQASELVESLKRRFDFDPYRELGIHRISASLEQEGLGEISEEIRIIMSSIASNVETLRFKTQTLSELLREIRGARTNDRHPEDTEISEVEPQGPPEGIDPC